MLLIHFLLCYNPVFTSVENGNVTQTKRKFQSEIFFVKRIYESNESDANASHFLPTYSCNYPIYPRHPGVCARAAFRCHGR